jgi:hypothetical protein
MAAELSLVPVRETKPKPAVQPKAPVTVRDLMQKKGLSKRERKAVEEVRVQAIELEGTRLITHQAIQAQAEIVEHAQASYASTVWRMNTRKNFVIANADEETAQEVAEMTGYLKGIYTRHTAAVVEESLTQITNTVARSRYIPRKHKGLTGWVVDALTGQLDE